MDNKWYERFYKEACDWSEYSKDPSTRVGAVIFNEDRQIKTKSYNGFPQGIADDERLHDREMKYKIIRHAEENAIFNCASEGVGTKDTSMAISTYPCSRCAGAIISAKIKRIITKMPTDKAFIERWQSEFDLAESLLNEAGIEVILLDNAL